MPKSRKLTEQEREQRRQADRDRLENAARELLTSDGWKRWVRVRSTAALGRYSLRNQWLISSECAKREIAPTHVAGFRAWLALDRVVRKGERAIYILAPVSVKDRDAEGEETGEKRTFFRAVPVFDAAMTEALPGMVPVPLSPPCEPIAGESHAHLLAPLERLAGELGYHVEYQPIDGATGGWCDSKAMQIVVDAGQPANARVRVLVHEIAHALGVGYEQYGRHQAEVLVDTVTYIVLAGQAGLDVGGESIPYVAGWGESGALDAIQAYADTIDQIARRIEDAIAPANAAAIAVPVDRPVELDGAAG
jgi:hypothetical protein